MMWLFWVILRWLGGLLSDLAEETNPHPNGGD